MLSDPVVLTAARNNLLWSVVTIVVPVTLGLALALLLNGKVRGKPVLRLIFYAPGVLPLVSIASIWGWLYNPPSTAPSTPSWRSSASAAWPSPGSGRTPPHCGR
ncbi:hypothetical protein [Nonomuraea salmonea]|uniref:hypothetical protein n=1 Tax=Nonomuraea salmonea TaxID=46181 RepID=UPI002FE99FDF